MDLTEQDIRAAMDSGDFSAVFDLPAPRTGYLAPFEVTPLSPHAETTQISLRLPVALLAVYDSIADRDRVSRSDLIRAAMYRELARHSRPVATDEDEVRHALDVLRAALLPLRDAA
ncbi:MAG TPA: hypothetical protein VE326_11260 [Candidatus Binatia bacterium]|nr:hypothetical protein [Candidatus Binatia bacterium]